MQGAKPLRLRINGKTRTVSVPPQRTLLEVLREDLRLTGAKHGCESGECGACTVLLGGRPVYSCILLASEAQGRDIRTIEGVSPRHPLVVAFADKGAVQCGYCTPGMILAAKSFLEKGCGGKGGGCAKPDTSEKALREAVSGNICRCTGYYKIIAAVKAASAAMTSTLKKKRTRGGRVVP